MSDVTVDIKRIHSVDIVSIGIEIYIIYSFKRNLCIQKNRQSRYNNMRHLPQCSYGDECYSPYDRELNYNNFTFNRDYFLQQLDMQLLWGQRMHLHMPYISCRSVFILQC